LTVDSLPSLLLFVVENWALFLHLLGAFVLVAGAAVAGVGFEAARRRKRPSEIALLLSLTRVGVLLIAIGFLLVVPFGLWLVHIDRIGYEAGWVDAALGLLVAVSALGGIGGQRPKRARKLATRLAQDGEEESVELRALLDDRLTLTLNYLSAILLVAIVALMVFKPGGPAG
jgi:uncharacterized membrane protein